MGVLHQIELEFEIENVVPLSEIPLAVKVAADGSQLHLEIAVRFETTVDGFEGPSTTRREARGQDRQGKQSKQGEAGREPQRHP